MVVLCKPVPGRIIRNENALEIMHAPCTDRQRDCLNVCPRLKLDPCGDLIGLRHQIHRLSIQVQQQPARASVRTAEDESQGNSLSASRFGRRSQPPEYHLVLVVIPKRQNVDRYTADCRNSGRFLQVPRCLVAVAYQQYPRRRIRRSDSYRHLNTIRQFTLLAEQRRISLANHHLRR